MIFQILIKNNNFIIEETDKERWVHSETLDDTIFELLYRDENELEMCSFDIGTKTIDETYKLISDAMYTKILENETTELIAKYSPKRAKCIVKLMNGRIKCLGYSSRKNIWESFTYSPKTTTDSDSRAILVTDNSKISLDDTEMFYEESTQRILDRLKLTGCDVVTKEHPLTVENLRKCVNIEGNIYKLTHIVEGLLRDCDIRIDELCEDIDQLQNKLGEKNQKMKYFETLNKTLAEGLTDGEKLLMELRMQKMESEYHDNK